MPATTAISVKKGSKVHAAVDTLGHLLALKVTPANEQERAQVGDLLAEVRAATGEKVRVAFVDQHDPFNQVVLRDTQRLFLPNASPMLPGQQRDFQVGYEHLPAQWNNGYPSIRVSGLSFK